MNGSIAATFQLVLLKVSLIIIAVVMVFVTAMPLPPAAPICLALTATLAASLPRAAADRSSARKRE